MDCTDYRSELAFGRSRTDSRFEPNRYIACFGRFGPTLSGFPIGSVLPFGRYSKTLRTDRFLDLEIGNRFGKCDNFPDRFGSDMQKYRFDIGRFGLLFGTDYIGSYCLERPNRC